MSKDKTTMMTTPDAPLRTPLKGECAPQVGNSSIALTKCKPDQAKATQDQGYQPMISASA